jgi:hypothetical protein
MSCIGVGLIAKCIFVARENEQLNVADVLERHFRIGSRPVVHLYRENGRLVDREPFTARLNQLVELGIGDWAKQLAAPIR